MKERNKLLEENLKKLQSENRKEIELMKKTLEKELRQLREAMTKVPKGKRPAPELFSLLRR